MIDGQVLVFDGHNDMLLKLTLAPEKDKRSAFDRGNIGHLDLPRMREGRFAGGFFAVFVPPGPPALLQKMPELIATKEGLRAPPFGAIDSAYAMEFTDRLLALLHDIEINSSGQFRIIHNAGELRSCLDSDVVAAVLHFEGAEAINPDLSNLQSYYDNGLRSLGLVWSRPNLFAEGVPFEYPRSPDTGPGLTDAGKELVEACNELGILIDLSHLNEKGFWDVVKRTSAPLVVTHTAVHSLCQTTRNITDKQIDAIAESGGVIGVNFHVGDLREGCWEDATVPMSDIIRHVDYLVDRIGPEHVAFGSDFDGAMIPSDLGDVAGLPKLIQLLRQSGHDDESIAMIARKNWLRVLERTWKEVP